MTPPLGVCQRLEQLVQSLAILPASVTASSSSRRSSFLLMSITSCPPYSDGHVAQHHSRSAWGTTPPPAIPCAYRPQAALEGRPVPDHCVKIRKRGAPRRGGADADPRKHPAAIDGPHPCLESLGAHTRSHAARLRPFDLKPASGTPWTRRVARRRASRKDRDTFQVLRSLPLPDHPRCMRLTRRRARHGGGPQSLRNKT